MSDYKYRQQTHWWQTRIRWSAHFVTDCRILPWLEVVNRPALAGDLRVEQCYDEELRRHVRMARLLDPATPGHARQPPTLLVVRLIAMSPSAFSLTGFERVEGAGYAQSRLVQGAA